MARARRLGVAIATTAASVLALSPSPSVDAQASRDPAAVGAWSAPFQETADRCVTDADGRELCVPAGSTVADLVTGRVLYWDALEGTENVNFSIVAEAGTTGDSRSRILDIAGDAGSFRAPVPADGGGDPAGDGGEYVLPDGLIVDPGYNDADLFCSDQRQLADGRIISVGGTDWYFEPALLDANGSVYGVGELEGTKAVRIFDPFTETWRPGASMTYGRWYPSLVTLPDGRLFVASGVTKLLKPLYDDRPLDSGRNVVQTEIYDVAADTWTVNPPTANRSLPLYPRLHLLPNGNVYYDAGGQVFNPMGQSYDETFWNIAASYDPDTLRWTDLGVPGLPLGLPDIPGISNDDLSGIPLLDELPVDGLPVAGGDPSLYAGFRGSAASIMLPLRPDDEGQYLTAEFLTAGGILGVSPGTYVATDRARVNTVHIDPDTGAETLDSRPTGALNAPRWYGTNVLTPTGEVLIFSGADRDEVVLPGTGMPVTTPELWNPSTGQWQPLAPQGRPRTYHNTAMLLPDGRVIVGGHAPISTAYGFNVTIPGGVSPNEGRDPSFELYSPPYLFRGPRPEVRAVSTRSIGTGTTFSIGLGSPADAARVAEGGTVTLIRNTAMTHLVDADQRAVELQILRVDGETLLVAAPPDPAVTPPGPYQLWVSAPGDGGLTPATSAVQVFVDAPVPAPLEGQLELPETQPGVPAEPIVPRDPVDVLVGNVERAFGVDDPTSATVDVPALRVDTRSIADARAVDLQTAGDEHAVPALLVAAAAVLPVALLLCIGGMWPGRRRRAPDG